MRDRWWRGAVLVMAALGLVAVLPTGCSEPSVEVTSDIVFGEYQGVSLALDRYESVKRPEGDEGEGPVKRAAIVMFHGGGWYSGDKTDLSKTAKGFAQAGFVALSVNYAIPPVGERFPAEVDTSRQAVQWVMDNADDLGIDAERVALYGSSAGGNLALMVALGGVGADRPSIKAVAAWSPPTDLAALTSPDGQANPANPPPSCGTQANCIGLITPKVVPDYVGCILSDCPDRYADASPVSLATAGAPPTYLTASETDFVPFDQCTRLAEALLAAGGQAQAVAIDGDDHAEDLRDDALSPTVEFFTQHLERRP